MDHISLISTNKLYRSMVRKNGRGRTGTILVRGKGAGIKNKRFSFFKNFGVSSKGFFFYETKKTKTLARQGFVYYDIGYVLPVLLEETLEKNMRIDNFMDGLITKRGSLNFLRNFIVGQYVYDISIQPKGVSKLAKAPGNYGVIFSKISNKVFVKMRSGWLIQLSEFCVARLGIVSNGIKKENSIGKAGINRRYGKRPHVRGVAMNPVDHPHGGGEGKKNPKKAKTPWGMLTKGYITKRKKTFLAKKRRLKLF